MRDKVKRFISILMTALMLVNLMPVGALADGITSIGYKPEVAASTGNYTVYVYARFDGDPLPGVTLNASQWYTIGYIANVNLPSPGGISWGQYWYYNNNNYCGSTINSTSASGIIGGLVQEYNTSIVIKSDEWISANFKACPGADTYKEGTSEPTWHLDIIVDINKNPPVHNLVFKVNNSNGKQIGTPKKVTGRWTNPLSSNKYYAGNPVPETIIDGGRIYQLKTKREGNPNLDTKIYFDEPIKNVEFYYKDMGPVKRNYTVNYSIELVFGKLEVTPVTDEVIVTITGRTHETTYDGKEHSVFGYDVTVSNALYTPKEDMRFNGIDADATAKGTDAGTYPMELTAENFTNISDNFTNVTFVVTDGYVKINPRAVTLTSETAGKTYDGTALEKPVVTVGGDGFVEGQVTEIKATGSVTNAGSVANTITFTPNKETFKEGNYAITKTEGTLTIAKRSVLITSQSATKTYDGSALTRPAVTITGDGFVPGELAKAEATGSITKVGSTPNAIRYTTTGAFNAANYSIALSVGTLTVTEKPKPEPRRTFNLTINYVYQNGKRAAASYNRGGLKNGETFDITSPVIAGYTASETVVSGTIYNRDIKVTVIYTADGVNLDDYGVPLGLGNITMNVGDCFE